MSRFDRIGAEYGAPTLNAQHGEPFTFHPRGSASRPVTGIVHRTESAESGQGPIVTIEVRDDSTNGIAISELDRGTGEVTIAAERPGGKTSRRRIHDFSDPVGGWITLEIR